MDKKSNRTDLLAAGRKKLQQFRQKKDPKPKDGKGKDGKSASKSSTKQDSSQLKDTDLDDANANVSANALSADDNLQQVESSQHSETQLESDASLPLVLENPTNNKAVKDSAATSTDPTGLSSTAVQESGLEDVVADNVGTSLDHGQGSLYPPAGEETNVGLHQVEEAVPLGSVVQVDVAQVGDKVAAQAGDLRNGDQVSVVGTMQEADSLGSTQVDQKAELEREEDELSVSISDGLGEFPDRSCDVTAVGASSCESDLAALDASVAAETLTVTPHNLPQQSDPVIESSSDLYQQLKQYEGIKDSDTTVAIECDRLYEPERSTSTKIEIFENSGEQNTVDTHDEQSASTGVEGTPTELDNLAELLKRLPEGDFWHLIKLRLTTDDGNSFVPKSVAVDLPQTIQEQLYLANISKDFLHVELLEQLEQQTNLDCQGSVLSNEVPAVTESLSTLQESNKVLVAELSLCRSELEAAMNEKMETQKLYGIAKEEAKDFSVRVEGLVKNLDEAVGTVSSLSAELIDCKVQLEASQVENENILRDLALVSEQRNHSKVVIEQCTRENEKLSSDLADSSTQLAALQQQLGSLKKKFEEETLILVQEKEMVSRDLLDCRHQMMALQQNNSELNTSLVVVNEELKKQKDFEGSLMQEIERLSAEVVVFRDNLLIQHQEREQHEADLNEAMSRLEQLAEENIILQSSLEIYKAKVSELDSRYIQMSSAGIPFQAKLESSAVGPEETSAKEDSESVAPSVFLAANEASEGSILGESRQDFHADSPVVVMKGYLEEAENLMRKLEKAAEGMHSHSVSLSRSISNNAAAGVSKLIQAFESKAHSDDLDPEVSPSAEDLLPSDSYRLAKQQLSHLRGLLKALAQNVERVDVLIVEEKVRSEAAHVSRAQLEVEIEALKGVSNNLTERNIELEVVYGAMNQHALDVEANKNQLEDLYEVLKQEYAGLQSKNFELGRRLTNSHCKLNELHVHLKGIQRGSAEVASNFHNEIETLKGEVMQAICAVEREWRSSFAELFPIIDKLGTLVISAVGKPPPSESSNNSGILGHLSFTLSATCEMIEKLTSRIEADESLSSSYREATEKLCNAEEERSLALALLQKVSADLVMLLNMSDEHVDGSGFPTSDNQQHDPLDAGFYEALVSRLTNLVGDLPQLKESNQKLYSDLLSRTNDIEELKKYSLDDDAVLDVISKVSEVLKLQGAEIDTDKKPVYLMQSLVVLLVQKFKELEEHASLLSDDYKSRVIELSNLQGNIDQLNSLHVQHQNEIVVLRESLTQAKDSLDAVQAELLEKTKELELSEQRVASVRDKLSIAVSKGKGLVVQRDSLKQSLAEMSSELEKCSQELQMKDSRILEVEEKLKAYSEAGERMEALESELTYIRNSATALRESFFMKDSTLQRIEEIMEDLELPEHFHSRDIVEKVDWLAKSAANNSFLPTDWDQISSVGGSHSDTGLITDGSKEDVQPTSDPVDDLRRKCDELQTNNFKLAEQADMLEQSLTERNILVQRWEEVLDRINTPPQIRAMEPEERIHWLGTALSEADNHMRSLQQKIEELENYCDSLSSDLVGSQRRISEHESSLQTVLQERNRALSEADDHMNSLKMKIHSLENHCGSLSSDLEESERRVLEFESSLQAVQHEKDILSAKLVFVTSDLELAVHRASQYEHDLDRLSKEFDALHGSLADKNRNHDYIQQTERELKRLQGLILEVLEDAESDNESPDMSNIHYLERLIKTLMTHGSKSCDVKENVQEGISELATNDILVTEVENMLVPVEALGDMDESKSSSTHYEGHIVTDLRKELANALDEVACLKVERDTYLQNKQSMARELEALAQKKEELREQLNQEEQKSTSLREKLNLAVRKGKSLVQQRDSLKQNIEELMAEMDRLRSEIAHRDSSLLESGQKITDLSLQIEAHKAFEAENLSLKNQLVEANRQLQQSGQTLSLVVDKLGEFDTGGEISALDPLQKLEGIPQLFFKLHAMVAVSEQEASKSKKAAELLLAELNEVQERNDDLQDELARAHNEITTLSRERDIADSAKVEALSHVAKFSDEKKVQLAEFERLKSSVNEVQKVFFDVSTLVDDALAKDIELLHNVRVHAESFLEHSGADLVQIKDYGSKVSVSKQSKDLWFGKSFLNNHITESPGCDVEQYLKQFAGAISDFRERVHCHSISVRAEIESFENAISTMVRETVSQRNSSESMKGEMIQLESIIKERDSEVVVLRRSMSLLYESCSSSVIEIESRKGQLVGQNFASEDFKINLLSLPKEERGIFCGSSLSASEECVKVLADKLLKAVKDFVDVEFESRESSGREMRNTISTLLKELQEKDIQRERICMELVSQIKAAESTAANCSRDLQSMKSYAHDLENELETVGRERGLLEQTVLELQQELSNSIDFGEKIKSLSELLSAKDQEIEALMQALEEEENQMEALKSKIEEMERAVQQKNSDLEHLEASRAKVVKKLSVTVNKFDELHHMSESLLSEIESLQSQLQDRDAEVSFLRQEVTRCTNDVLEVTKMSKERNSADLFEFLKWLDTTLSRVVIRDSVISDDTANKCIECKDILQKDIMNVVTELEHSRVATHDKDVLLQAQRNKIEELSHREAALEASLSEKEVHSNSLQGMGNSGLGTSEIVEVEPLLNKWTAPVTNTASQVRSLRKANNDQVAIAIDTEAESSGRYDDEEDDKVHGFKSLTTSRFIPKFTRPVSDMIDGLWVSCDRALMRQPALRLGIMLYWALLHAFLASIIV